VIATAPIAAEARGRRWIQLTPIPQVLPASSCPPLGFPDGGAVGNRLWWWLLAKGVQWSQGARINRLRRGCGVPPAGDPLRHLQQQLAGALIAVSPTLFPTPAEWPRCCQSIGALTLPAAEGSGGDPGLDAFIERGDPPLYLGFGSMSPFADPDGQLLRLWLDPLREAGLRAILHHPAATAVAAGDPDLFALEQAVNHSLLLPRCLAAVHHGGAGTTHAVCRAGIPSLIVPHLVDQRFWGERVAALGAGPPPVDLRRLTPGRIRDRLARLADDHAIRRQAALIGQQMAWEGEPQWQLERIGSLIECG
jgi:sterol 3beta-glucosyltransferase